MTAESKLYQTITCAIKENIDCGKLLPGDKVPSVNELREKYGISHITAVRVYKELSTMNYIFAKRGCGYFVSDCLTGGAKNFTGKIGNFLRPLRDYNVSDNYFNTVNFAIQDECYKRHLNLLGSYTTLPLSHPPYNHTDLQNIVNAMLEMVPDVDGFLVDERIPDELLKPVLLKLGKALVIVNRSSRLPVVTVTPPNHDGMMAILEAAHKFGYDSYIFGEMSQGSQNEIDRRAAFYEFLEKHRVSSGLVRVIDRCGIYSPELTERRLETAIGELGGSGRKVLFVASSDYLGRQIADYLYQKYGSFDQVGLVSFNGFELAFNKPELATVRVDPAQLGMLAVCKLHEQLTSNNRRQAINYSTDVAFTLGTLSINGWGVK